MNNGAWTRNTTDGRAKGRWTGLRSSSLQAIFISSKPSLRAPNIDFRLPPHVCSTDPYYFVLSTQVCWSEDSTIFASVAFGNCSYLLTHTYPLLSKYIESQLAIYLSLSDILSTSCYAHSNTPYIEAIGLSTRTF
jgi:hypothetical protein